MVRIKRKKMELRFKGIPVSPGIFIGRVIFFLTPRIDIRPRKIRIEDIEQEVARFMRARQSYISELERMKSSFQGGLISLIDTQIAMLRDGTFEREVLSLIRNQQRPAEYAIDRAIQNLTRSLRTSDSEYMRERANEMERLAHDLIRKMGDLEPTAPRAAHIRNKVVLAYDLSIQDTLNLIKKGAKGFAVAFGGITSHAAIIIRNYKLPAVFGLGEEFVQALQNNEIIEGDRIIVDGSKGHVIVNPKKNTVEQYKRLLEEHERAQKELLQLVDKPTVTEDGIRFAVNGNIDLSDELQLVMEFGGHGIGLFRTEFLFQDYGQNEDGQTRVYRNIARHIYPGHLVIRLFDLGADKLIGTMKPETALGMRGIRALLLEDSKKTLRTQVRAILRANRRGNIKLMVPMISTIEEIIAVKEIVQDEFKELRKRYRRIQFPEFGVMVETPSAAILSDKIAELVDFISIGTNDLTQYVLAVDRADARLSFMFDHLHPSVVRLVCRVVEAAHKAHTWVSVCGEMASDPLAVPLLVAMRIDEFSVAPGAILVTKKIINSIDQKSASKVLEKVLNSSTVDEVREIMVDYLKSKGLDIETLQ